MCIIWFNLRIDDASFFKPTNFFYLKSYSHNATGQNLNFPSLKLAMSTCPSYTGIHQENMFVKQIPPYTPLLYSKNGVSRGIPIFRIFAPKHRLWVLVRKFSFLQPKIVFRLLHGRVFVKKKNKKKKPEDSQLKALVR